MKTTTKIKHAVRLRTLASQHARLAVGFALACGFELERLIAAAPHGQAGELTKSFPGGQSSLRRYRLLVQRIEQRNKLLYKELKKLLPRTITSEEMERILPQLTGAVDGAGLTAMYQDYGVLKPRKKPSLPDIGNAPGRRMPGELDQLWFSFESSVDVLARNFDEIRQGRPDLHLEIAGKLTEMLESLTGDKWVPAGAVK